MNSDFSPNKNQPLDPEDSDYDEFDSLRQTIYSPNFLKEEKKKEELPEEAVEKMQEEVVKPEKRKKAKKSRRKK